MKTLLALIAIAAVALANPIQEQNNLKEEVAKAKTEKELEKDWLVTEDGTLIPVLTPVSSDTEVKVGEANGSPIKVGVKWCKNEDGNLVAVPSEDNKSDSELSCNAGHCVRKFQLLKNVESGVEENKGILVDWFKAKDGSLIGVPRTESVKAGNANDGKNWFVAGDGTTLLVPQSSVPVPEGSVEIGGQSSESKEIVGIKIKWFENSDGNLSPEVVPVPAVGKVSVSDKCQGSTCNRVTNVLIDWYLDQNGVIVITPKPAKSHISGGICRGKECSVNLGVLIDWNTDDNNNVSPIVRPIIRPENEDNLVENYRRGLRPVGPPFFPLWTLKPRRKSYAVDEESLDPYKDQIPIISVDPKDNTPRVIYPKSYNMENEKSLDLFGDKIPTVPIVPMESSLTDPVKSTNFEQFNSQRQIILERDGQNPNSSVNVIIDSKCNGPQIKNLKCNERTIIIGFFRMPNGEIMPQAFTDEEIPETVSVSQISPTTASFHVTVKAHAKCRKGLKKCKGGINVGVSNRKRRDLAEGFIQEIYRTNLNVYEEDLPLDLIFQFPQSL